MSDNIKEKTEDKVIDLINFGAHGRLIIFKTDGKNGKDLVVEKRGEYESVRKIYLQVNEGFSKKIFVPEKDFYLLFLHFDEVLQKISDKIWLVPSSEFKGGYSENQLSKFLMAKDDLGDFLFGVFGKTRKIDHSKDFLKKNIT